MVIYEFGAWLIILFLLAHAILIADAASQGKSPLHFSELEGRHVLTDVRDCPTYAAGIVYDPPSNADILNYLILTMSSRKITEKLLLWVAQLFFGYNNEVKLTNGDKKR